MESLLLSFRNFPRHASSCKENGQITRLNPTKQRHNLKGLNTEFDILVKEEEEICLVELNNHENSKNKAKRKSFLQMFAPSDSCT